MRSTTLFSQTLSNWIWWSSQRLEPLGVGQAALDRVAREELGVDVQVGRMQRLRSAARARHQHADLGEGGPRLVAELQHRPLHVAQVGAAVARLVAGEGLVDRA